MHRQLIELLVWLLNIISVSFGDLIWVRSPNSVCKSSCCWFFLLFLVIEHHAVISCGCRSWQNGIIFTSSENGAVRTSKVFWNGGEKKALNQAGRGWGSGPYISLCCCSRGSNLCSACRRRERWASKGPTLIDDLVWYCPSTLTNAHARCRMIDGVRWQPYWKKGACFDEWRHTWK